MITEKQKQQIKSTSEQMQEDIACILDGMEGKIFYNHLMQMVVDRMSNLVETL